MQITKESFLGVVLMVTIRNFTYDDMEILRPHGYQNMAYDEIRQMISQWNRKEYQGKYFEMFERIMRQALHCIGVSGLNRMNTPISIKRAAKYFCS